MLKKLDQLDPLPDTIFGISDPLREKTLFNLVSKNLPEYIDSYAKTVLIFTQGQVVFQPEIEPLTVVIFITYLKISSALIIQKQFNLNNRYHYK